MLSLLSHSPFSSHSVSPAVSFSPCLTPVSQVIGHLHIPGLRRLRFAFKARTKCWPPAPPAGRSLFLMQLSCFAVIFFCCTAGICMIMVRNDLLMRVAWILRAINLPSVYSLSLPWWMINVVYIIILRSCVHLSSRHCVVCVVGVAYLVMCKSTNFSSMWRLTMLRKFEGAITVCTLYIVYSSVLVRAMYFSLRSIHAFGLCLLYADNAGALEWWRLGQSGGKRKPLQSCRWARPHRFPATR